MSVNKVILVGRLGTDPDYKKVGSSHVCTFSLATSESYKDKQGQKQDKTEWHRIEVWGNRAAVCSEYLKKGSQAYVEGKLKTDEYKKDGQTRYITKINALNVQFLSPVKQNASGQDFKSQKQVQAMLEQTKTIMDEIPF